MNGLGALDGGESAISQPIALPLRNVRGVPLAILLVPAHILRIPHLLILLPPPLSWNPHPRLCLIPHRGCALDVKCQEFTFSRGVLSSRSSIYIIESSHDGEYSAYQIFQ